MAKMSAGMSSLASAGTQCALRRRACGNNRSRNLSFRNSVSSLAFQVSAPGLGIRSNFRCKGLRSSFRIGEQTETDKLPSSARELTMKSIDSLGGRVTVGDVATSAGLDVTEAQRALQALATDVGGFLEVSDEGDVLYVFPKDYRVKLLTKSFRLKFEPVLEKLKTAAGYVVRVSFGTTLIASVVIVYTSIFVLLASARGEDDNRSGRGYSSRSPGVSFYISPYDFLWYWDPTYRRRATGDMSFLESVFSFVFGDGDPNEGRDKLRWQAIGEQIAAKGGVVTAEELTPFLDVPPLSESSDDDSFVLPVLLRFDGMPEVDSEGNIVYRFPSLQRTGTQRTSPKYSRENQLQFFKELPSSFSQASGTKLALVVALGVFNLLGVLTLGALMRDFAVTAKTATFLQLASRVFPFLQAYTVAFFAIPLIRWLRLSQKNNEVEARNMARKERAVVVKQPTSALRRKLNSARDLAERTYIGQDRIVYTTEKDLLEQDYEAREWERRLEER